MFLFSEDTRIYLPLYSCIRPEVEKMKKLLPIVMAFLLAFPVLLHAQWQSLHGPDGGTINVLYRYNTTVFAGTAAGIFRSSDDGQTWTYAYGGVDRNNFV